MKFEKYYVLDTNILLEDATNIYKLSQEGKNLIVLPETVLDELDSKKSGFDEINFQAREFARILENSEILNSIKKESYKI
ncbi:MAG: phosphate starvation-inducible protein PhoH, partial [Aliarcobacter sp.]|nr:phosphate starvation-inducible protein PhoH [Aliarcobacter sp.]